MGAEGGGGLVGITALPLAVVGEAEAVVALALAGEDLAALVVAGLVAVVAAGLAAVVVAGLLVAGLVAVLLALEPSNGTTQGVAPQISSAYCWMVRSLENLPTLAMLWTTICTHFLRSV